MTGRHYQHGVVLFDMGRYREAVEAFSAELTSEPTNATALAMRAASWINAGNISQAQRDILDALRNEPGLAYSHFVLSYVRASQGRAADAEVASREAIRIDPSASHFHRLGEILFARHRIAESKRIVAEGLAADPGHVPLLLLKAKVLSSIGLQEEARACMRLALAQRPEDSSAHHSFGSLLLSIGESADAKELLREARRLNPVDHHDRDSLAAAYGRLVWPLRVVDQNLIRYETWTPRRRWCFLVLAALIIVVIGHVFEKLTVITMPFFLIVFNLIVAPMTLDLFASPLGKIFFRRDLDIRWYRLLSEPLHLSAGLVIHGAVSAFAVVCAIQPVFTSIVVCLVPNLEMILEFIRKPTAIQKLLYGAVGFNLVVFPMGMAMAFVADRELLSGAIFCMFFSLFFSYLLTVHWR